MRDGNEDESCGSGGGEEANFFERAGESAAPRKKFIPLLRPTAERERDRDQREIEMPTPPRPPLEKRDGEQNLRCAN